ncbi:PP2C family protein-serine/threonine phosphatase [Lentzea atacamensis]|uniref:PP2C family protein-serine/threonine phosphatase n=1 Tax=Lentzea atacamensis TaxID=531938 RepID=UPI00147273D6|nr:SpoIIE family protein phosphatase [Lentzea atacamensis]
MPLRAATATREGSTPPNMDAAAIFESETGAIAAAVVDGIGKDPVGAKAMQLVADVAVRIAPSRQILAAILTAAGVIDDAGTEDHVPDGVIAVALTSPGDVTLIGWVGDSHIYSWNGERLLRRTTPHTMGEYLRQNGDIDLAPEHDNWVRIALSTATPATVALAEIPHGELVIIASDGLDETLLEEIEALVKQHAEDPQALADALVGAVREDDEGHRDDATVAVLLPLIVGDGVG